MAVRRVRMFMFLINVSLYLALVLIGIIGIMLMGVEYGGSFKLALTNTAKPIITEWL